MTETKQIYEPAPNSKAEIDRFNEKIAAITGTSPVGKGFLKVDWAMDLTKFYGGIEQIKYGDVNGKYVGMPYYVLESWDPPEVYNRIEWAQLRYEDDLDILGPFPRTGTWKLFRVCRRPDLSMMPLGDEILEIVRNWRHHATRPNAAQRAVADYIQFNEDDKAIRDASFEAYKAELRAELAEELAKPELNAAFSFPEAARTKDEVPSGFKRIESDLIVPK